MHESGISLPGRIMKNRRNYYRILQVQPDAPPEIIHASYRTLMRELKKHPDLGGSASEASILNEAYETLRDPLRRADYDKAAFAGYPKGVSSRSRQPAVAIACPICRQPLSRNPKPGETCPTCRTPLKSDGSPKPEQANQRAFDRAKTSDLIVYHATWPGKAEQGRMIDLSPKGARFICGEKLALKTVLKISSRLFEASGTVTNLSENVSGRQKNYVVGVYFLAVHFKESRGTFLSTSA